MSAGSCLPLPWAGDDKTGIWRKYRCLTVTKAATFGGHRPFARQHLGAAGRGMARRVAVSWVTRPGQRRDPQQCARSGCSLPGSRWQPPAPAAPGFGESSGRGEGRTRLLTPPSETAASARSMLDVRASMCEAASESAPGRRRQAQAGTWTTAARFHRKPGWSAASAPGWGLKSCSSYFYPPGSRFLRFGFGNTSECSLPPTKAAGRLRPAIGGGQQQQPGSPLPQRRRVPPPAGFPCFQKVPFCPQNQQLCLAFYKPRDIFSAAPHGVLAMPGLLMGCAVPPPHPGMSTHHNKVGSSLTPLLPRGQLGAGVGTEGAAVREAAEQWQLTPVGSCQAGGTRIWLAAAEELLNSHFDACEGKFRGVGLK